MARTRSIVIGGYGEKAPAEFRQLARRLVDFAGDAVVWLGSEAYLRRLMRNGKFFTERPVTKRSYQRACHGNTARNAASKGWTIYTGYGLSDDGLWRVHSWNRDERDRLIETTLLRVAYYGIKLTGRSAERFIEQNEYNW